jgi:cation/acetate symporter
LISAVACVITGPTIWVSILGHAEPIFPYKHPALFSMSAAFISIYLFSIYDRSPHKSTEIKAFDNQFVQSIVGSIEEKSNRF